MVLTCNCSLAGTDACFRCPAYIKEFGTVNYEFPIFTTVTYPVTCPDEKDKRIEELEKKVEELERWKDSLDYFLKSWGKAVACGESECKTDSNYYWKAISDTGIAKDLKNSTFTK